MFVPSTRLLWLVFYAALIGAGAGPFPQLQPVWLVAVGLILFAAVFDLGWTLSRGRPPRVTLPPIARFMRDREAPLALTFENPAGRAQRVRVGLGLPPEFDSRDEELLIDLPAGAQRATAPWHCTPRRRGRFAGAVVAIETASPAGLWLRRVRSEVACDLRVHPNLLTERRSISALFLARGLPGARVQRTLGRGREFEKLRDYLPGDGFDVIHWKATAKRGRPVTKVFQAERTQEIYVVIDGSRLSARPVEHAGIEQPVLERYVTSAMVLLLAAGRNGDKFGLVTFDDRVRACVRAGGGAAHYGACREAILGVKPTEATPDVAEVVRFLRTRLRQRALLFFLTDLSDPVLAEDFARQVTLLARQHLVVVGQLPPPQVARLFAGADVRRDDDVYARYAGHVRWAEARLVAQTLKSRGVNTLTLDNERMAAQLVTQYMQVKARQAL